MTAAGEPGARRAKAWGRPPLPALLSAALLLALLIARPAPPASAQVSILQEKDSYHWYVEAKYLTLKRMEYRKALLAVDRSLAANPWNPRAKALKEWLEAKIKSEPAGSPTGTAEVALGTGEVALGTGEVALGTGEVRAATGEALLRPEIPALPAGTLDRMERDLHLRMGEDALARMDYAKAREEFLLDLKENPDRAASMFYIVKHTIDNGDWMKGLTLLNRLTEKVAAGAELPPDLRAVIDHQLRLYQEAAFLGKGLRTVNRDITTRKMARQSYAWRNVVTDLPGTSELFLEEKPLESLDVAALKRRRAIPPGLSVEARDFLLDRDGLVYPRYNFFREKKPILLPKITREYQVKKDIRNLLEQGDYYARIGSYDRALKFFRDAVKLDPGSAMAHNNLGVVHKVKGRIDEAIDAFKTAIALEPSYAEPLNNLGIIYSEMGDLPEARRLFEISSRLNPRDARTWYNLGLVDEKRGDTKRAVEGYRKALEVNPLEEGAIYHLGKIHLDRNEKKEALRYFRKLKGILPRGSEEYEDLIRLLQSIEK